ncbi:metal ABC transporter substrate-binding protein [Anaeromyxobacter sp. Fw109-5]|uniref:metal ABC transporter substrate-binding protein n=1 Tax=Anaeromyxobacter sp. (strain Fw109-5) TaxID=404589 RepID=UPI0000ED7E0B|nr:metal ABC transporter substrate-binding protein [Anaeromyxobacter sp. Fw109-5]ABS25741.1 periplasmic solute binding protein [Anaeromyxobacter sp. Fw109-5]
MRTPSVASLALLLPALAAADPRIVTTTEGLAALAREVAGGRARVESLSRGVQDPHFVDANPILAVKLRDADLLVDVGLELEVGWLPPLVTQSRNARIQPGGPARLTAASAIQVLDVPTGVVDRSRGDLHAGGNPHFLTDPRRALQVAAAIAERLAALDPGGADAYRGNLAAFRARIDAAIPRWQAALAPVKGRKLITQHRTLPYFLAWTGLESAGELEPKPGVPPPPAHLADLVQVARREGVKAIVLENYYDRRSADVVARHAGAKVVQIPGDVGGEPGVGGYEQYIGVLVDRIAGTAR